jgi:hypothetical protein
MTEAKLHSKAGDARQPTSGLEPLIYNLITSAQSGVAGRCTGLQIAHRQRVCRSLSCSPLQGIACGLG